MFSRFSLVLFLDISWGSQYSPIPTNFIGSPVFPPKLSLILFGTHPTTVTSPIRIQSLTVITRETFDV